MTANILTDREIALSTSGLSTLDDTLAQDAPLQLTLAQPYPEPDDV